MNDFVPDWTGNLYNDKVPVKIPKEDLGVIAIYGNGKEKICCHTFISTDDNLISYFIVPAGQSFEPPDLHSGDEVYYVLYGEAHIFNPETGQLAYAKENDVVFIPRKSWHQVYNFSEGDVFLIAIITGKPWVVGDMDLVEKKDYKSIYFNENK